MTRFAYTTTRRIFAVSVSASLAFLLSTTVSHQAIAACSGAVGGTIVCTDDSEIPFNNSVDFSTTGASSTDGNYTVKVMATPGNDGEAVVENSNNIAASLDTLSAGNTQFRVYGMKGSDAYGIEEWLLENSGSISASHKGLGEVAGVFLQNDAEAWTIENTGTISVQRGPLTNIAVTTAGAITAKDGFGTTGTLGIAAGIYNNEEEISALRVATPGFDNPSMIEASATVEPTTSALLAFLSISHETRTVLPSTPGSWPP
ncbi:hypothetical protein [Hyphomicrobium sp.]|uniref:hypothetical protein n=1 Tax=Hyphomicrobium sp. TaxID=82 RepID=UPI002E37FAAB|nr:hypothetical protein [Hyphomicrobium sp.]HEX2841607.1 hypothetical protein [Hyphomicrobium sp.]